MFRSQGRLQQSSVWVLAAVCLRKAPESLTHIYISTLLKAQGTNMGGFTPEAKSIHISSNEAGEGRKKTAYGQNHLWTQPQQFLICLKKICDFKTWLGITVPTVNILQTWTAGCHLIGLQAGKQIPSSSSKQPRHESSWTSLRKFLHGGRFAQSQHSFPLQDLTSPVRPSRVRINCPKGQVYSWFSRVVLLGHSMLNGNMNNSDIHTLTLLFQSNLKLIYEDIDMFQFYLPSMSSNSSFKSCGERSSSLKQISTTTLTVICKHPHRETVSFF